MIKQKLSYVQLQCFSWGSQFWSIFGHPIQRPISVQDKDTAKDSEVPFDGAYSSQVHHKVAMLK